MTTPETAQPKTWTERLIKSSIGLRQAERLLQASGLSRRGRLVERLVKKTQDGTLGKSTADDSGAEDVIQVGDNHYQVLPAPSNVNRLLTAALAATLGAGGALGAWWLSRDASPIATEPPPIVSPAVPIVSPAVPIVSPAEDTDTRYKLRLVD